MDTTRDNIDERLTRRGDGLLPGMFGIEVFAADKGTARMRMVIRPDMLAPNGYLHAAAVIALADTAAGYGTMGNLPPGAKAFTTIELKSNFTGTAKEGTLVCEARAIHGGRLTQVWDAEVTHVQTGRTIARFRCTQMILFERLNECLT
jgi:uncharacterized protein (TIGR00369 family)